MSTDGSGDAPTPRWPRRRRNTIRTRTDPTAWDPDRPGEDLPSLGGTLYLTGLGLLVLAGLAYVSPVVAGSLYAVLLVWSVAVEATGNRLTTRVRSSSHALVWTLLRPAFAIGMVVHGAVEAVASLFG